MFVFKAGFIMSSDFDLILRKKASITQENSHLLNHCQNLEFLNKIRKFASSTSRVVKKASNADPSEHHFLMFFSFSRQPVKNLPECGKPPYELSDKYFDLTCTVLG